MAPRANWKGFLKIGEVQCPVALYTAASTSDRIAFHTINRATGHRVRRQYVDGESGEPVAGEDQVKGFEVGRDDYIILEDDEIASTVPESDKTIAVQAFLRFEDVDPIYFDRPYYLAPSDRSGLEAFTLIREAMRAKGVAALAQAVLFRRVRPLLIRPHDSGLIASTLNFNYEVRSARDAFTDVPELKIEGEMLDLAEHIIDKKRGAFDPRAFDDRYEAALVALVKAKLEGGTIVRPAPRQPEKVVNLIDALRESAGLLEPKAPAKRSAGSRRKKATGSERKAG